jgi:hypothetical protein
MTNWYPAKVPIDSLLRISCTTSVVYECLADREWISWLLPPAWTMQNPTSAELVLTSYHQDMDESLEGWYTDPYARHEARWMSRGRPTALVRDGKVEGQDTAPDGPFMVIPVMVEGLADASNGADLRRADDAERGSAYDPQSAARRAWEASGEGVQN